MTKILCSRVKKLEGMLSNDNEIIMQIGFVKPRGQDWTKEEKHKFPPVNDQIEAARASGKKIFMVFENIVDYWEGKL